MHRRITGKLVIATHNPGKLAEMRELLEPHGVQAISAEGYASPIQFAGVVGAFIPPSTK